MSLPVVVTDPARADIARAGTWYESRELGRGLRFVEEVELTFARIAQWPSMYRVVKRGWRRAAVSGFPYGVWYKIRPDHSLVIGCLHGRQEGALDERLRAAL